MTFTELEYVLMLAVAVLLWRGTALRLKAEIAEDRANKYARWMTAIHRGEGKIVDEGGGLYFKELNQ